MRSSAIFPPTLDAAQARLAAVRPAAYERTRNALDGAVTQLSPYITHGLLSLPEVLRGVLAQGPLPVQHRFVAELGWRAWFQQAWADRGDGILQSWHAGPRPEPACTREMPADVREARTGLPVVDRAVQQLYATGWLHNHARMWLASYLVHGRGVHWRTGADWLYGHLLDGDLASNHLSWQWVAGTASSKPYLFNAENVARYAPPDWHCAGSEIDTDYDTLARRAAGTPFKAPLPAPPGADEPRCSRVPPAALGAGLTTALGAGLTTALGAVAPDAAAVHGREVWLVHPWSLGALPDDLPPQTVVIGVLVDDFHRAWPWSPARWAFVSERLAALAPLRWHGTADDIGRALAGARCVCTVDNPHIGRWLGRWAEVLPAPALFPPVARRCDSFSQWWTRSIRGLEDAGELLAALEAQR